VHERDTFCRVRAVVQSDARSQLRRRECDAGAIGLRAVKRGVERAKRLTVSTQEATSGHCKLRDASP